MGLKKVATLSFVNRAIVLLVALACSVTTFSAPATTSEDSRQVSDFLNQVVTWYHHLAVEREIATGPSDIVFVDDNTHIAAQIVRLAFDFARSQAQLTQQINQPNQSPTQDNDSRYKALAAAVQKLDAKVSETQGEVDALRRKIEVAPPRKRADLQATLAETESELQLFTARRDVVKAILDFVGSNTEGTGPTGLSAQIEALSHSLPAALSAPSNAANQTEPTQPTTTTTIAPKPESSGLWGLITNIVSSARRIHLLDDEIHQTEALAKSCKDLQAPLLAQLKQMAQQSDAIAAQADNDPKALLAQDKNQLDNLTAKFKLLSASFLPLSKETVLVDVYLRNLTSWRSSLRSQYVSLWKDLLLRLLSLAIILAIVFGIAEVWRRAIFRYIHETRRRYQMLLIRRIVVWVVGALVVAFAFATELGSVATFAGLITAGVAVALQNVILSVAGYFFLIGKFGVRVGDRVQIGGVLGEVVDIGLVRIHVMELAGYGRDLQPTGRVVAFSNSFVFQPTAGMFKQIPGTNFVWHEITLTLAFEGAYRSVEQRMMRALDAAFAPYHDRLERQRNLIETNLGSVSVNPLRPRTSFRLTSAGLEVKVSFPVEVDQATDIDDRVTREILRELDREPKLKMVGSDIPTIREVSEAPKTS